MSKDQALVKHGLMDTHVSTTVICSNLAFSVSLRFSQHLHYFLCPFYNPAVITTCYNH